MKKSEETGILIINQTRDFVSRKGREEERQGRKDYVSFPKFPTLEKLLSAAYLYVS